MNLQQRASGVLLHISSLPGPNGIGDFGPDAQRFVDWLQGCGQRIWQWLPTTPIGPGDSPYQSVSAFAGSPLMVALEPLVAKGWLPEWPAAPSAAQVWPDGRVDFARVVPWRLQQLRAAAAGFAQHASAADRAELAAWVQAPAQRDWLDDYSLFMAIEAAQAGQPWWCWPEPLRHRDARALDQVRAQQTAEIELWQFVQWQFDTQCAELKSYANQRGVAIMGDLPIFVAHHSADCWARPDLYLLDEHSQPTVVAGVPPDDLGPMGQRWGNPLYRWDRMAAEGYAWWAARVRRMLTQADVFRIDHFRGFAGYFEIPASSPDATTGRWLPGPGQALFDAIAQALGPLPIVAEDLGFITPDVHALREGCGFPGMKILQFAFGGGADHDYLPHSYERNVVAYTGTHDNDTALGWWRGASERERRFAGSYLACGEHDVHWAMLRVLLNSVANIAVFPLQDVMGLAGEHRMNTPGTLGDSNWTWRFDWPQLGHEPGRVLGLLTAASGRGPFSLLGVGDPPAPAAPAVY